MSQFPGVSHRLGRRESRASATGVKVREEKGNLIVDDVMGFLGVLDRRMYLVELVKGSPEPFRAASRSRIGTQS